jgi:two-component system chemotaxis response regulator CheB
MSAVRVKIAAHGEPFRPGQIFMAPGDANLRVVPRDGAVVALLERLPEKGLGCMPSVDALFSSAARTMADKTLGILLTGMGRDGVKGMAAIKIMGGRTVAQDESSSIVFGMPRAAIESGTVDQVLSSREIPDLLMNYAKNRR